jgi:hypothetical protein
MRLQSDLRTELVEVQFWSRAEARIALDQLEEIPAITIDIVRARIERGDVAYELLIYGPAREVRRAVRECGEWSPDLQLALSRAC